MATRPTLTRERQLLAAGARTIVGLDEVGRGALAGPVAVGAVAVSAASARRAPTGIRDSKYLTARARTALVTPIRKWCLACAVGWATAAEIDAWGLTVALRLAAIRALVGLDNLPLREGRPRIDVVLLDGNHNYLGDPSELSPGAISGAEPGPDSLPDITSVVTEVQADRKRVAVAAASIVAKTARDALMDTLEGEGDRYGWTRNKGYASPAHRAGLRQWGPSPHHRLSWRLSASFTD